MSREAVDERLVEMKFDNEDFESGVSKSLGTLEKLKSALAFDHFKDGFSSIQNGIEDLSFSPIEDGLYGLQDSFGMIEMIGLRAMQRIADAALDMGQKLVSAIAIDPIKSGFQEYETQIGAVQTIMANTEEAFKDVSEQQHLDEVNSALDELNHYADKTIYNFTEMTRNIGTFTAAGVSLKESKTAIQGIANMAAVSGSTSQQASNAMYQLSQALASGTVKLMDWNSVVNAGMGGSVFKNALMESSKALTVANEKVQTLAKSGKSAEEIAAETGIELDRVSKLMKDGYATSYDAAIEKHGNFRESLTEGWITSEVLIDALRNATLNLDDMTEEEQEASKAMLKANGYTDEQIDGIFRLGKSATEAATKVKTFSQLIDTTKEALQSGWTQSWEYIIGDFGEAKSLWTGISEYLGDVINKSADARNAILQAWHDGDGKNPSGRTKALEGLTLAVKALISYGTVAKKEVFSKFIPDITVDTLNKFSDGLNRLGKYLQPSSEQLETFRRRLDNFVSPLKLVQQVIKVIGNHKDTMVDALKGVGSTFMDATEKISKFMLFVRSALSYSGLPGIIGRGIVDLISGFLNGISTLYQKAKEVIFAFFGISDDFVDKTDSVVNGGKRFGKQLGAIFDAVRDKVASAKTAISDVFDKIAETIKNLYGVDIKSIFTWQNFLDHVAKFGESVRSLPATMQAFKKSIVDTFTSALQAFNNFTGLNLELPTWEKLYGYISDFGKAILEIPLKIQQFKQSVSEGFDSALKSFNDFTGLNLHIPTWEEFVGFLTATKDTILHWRDNFNNARVAVQGFFDYIWDKLAPVRQMLEDATQSVKNFFGSFKKDKETEEGINVISRVSNAMHAIGEGLAAIGNRIVSVVTPAWEKLKGAISKIDFNKMFAFITGGAFIKTLLNFSNTLRDIKKTVSFDGIVDFIDDIGKRMKKGLELVQEVLEPFGDTLAAFQNKLKADMLKNIAIAVAILVGSLIVVSLVDPNKLWAAIGVISALMGELMGSLYGFQKIVDGTKTKDFGALTTGLVKLAAAVLILGFAMKVISSVDDRGIIASLASIGVLIALMGGLAETVKDVDGKNFNKTAKGLVVVAIAVWVLAGTVRKLADLKWEQLAKGLIGTVILLESLALFTKLSDMTGMGIGKGVGLILLANAIRVLANVTLMFVGLRWEAMAKGLVAVAALLGSLALATKFGDLEKIGMFNGIGLFLLAKGIGVLAEAALSFVKISWENMSKGLLGVIGLLLSLTIATKLMPKNMLGIGVGMVIAAAAINLMVNALKSVGLGMDWEQLAKGMTAIAGGLIAMGIGAQLMEGSLAGAAAMMVMAIAMNMFVPAMLAFGNMEWEQIAKSLAMIAGVFTIIGVASYLLSPFIGVILALSVALMAIGISSALAGTGMLAAAAGFQIFTHVGEILAAMRNQMNLEYAKQFLAFIGYMVPEVAHIIASLMLTIINIIKENIVGIVSAAVEVITAVLNAVLKLAPLIIKVAIVLLVTFLQAINENIYLFTLLGASILINFMNGLSLALPNLIEAGINLVVQFIDGIAVAIVDNTDRILIAIQNVMLSVEYFILSAIQDMVADMPVIGGQISGQIDKLKAGIEEKINKNEGEKIAREATGGVKKGLDDSEPEVRTSANNLSTTINDELKKVDASQIKDSVKEGVVGGISESQGDAANAAGGVGGAVTSTLEAYDTASGGAEMVNKIVGGIQNGGPDVKEVASSLGSTALGGFTDVDFSGGGGNFVDEITKGIDDKTDDVEKAGFASGEAGAGDRGFGGSYDSYYDSGGHLMEGGAQGIYDNVRLVRDAGAYAGTESLNAYNEASGVASPSWKFAQSGMFQMMGGANGIRQNVSLLTSASKFAGDETVDAFNEAIDGLAAVEYQINDSPSIRPVLDLSNIQNGIGQIDSMFSRDMATSVRLSPTANMDIGSAVGSLADLTGKSNGDIVNTLKTQIAMTSQLINVLKNQKIYLDGKTCVGGMVNEIDKQLGRKQILAGRRGHG